MSDALWERKDWGYRRRLFASQWMVADTIHGLGGRSSTHTHESWNNTFCVTRGAMVVGIPQSDGTVARHNVIPDKAVFVSAGVPHFMEFESECTALEIYTPADNCRPLNDPIADIQRLEPSVKHAYFA